MHHSGMFHVWSADESFPFSSQIQGLGWSTFEKLCRDDVSEKGKHAKTHNE